MRLQRDDAEIDEFASRQRQRGKWGDAATELDAHVVHQTHHEAELKFL